MPSLDWYDQTFIDYGVQRRDVVAILISLIALHWCHSSVQNTQFQTSGSSHSPWQWSLRRYSSSNSQSRLHSRYLQENIIIRVAEMRNYEIPEEKKRLRVKVQFYFTSIDSLKRVNLLSFAFLCEIKNFHISWINHIMIEGKN